MHDLKKNILTLAELKASCPFPEMVRSITRKVFGPTGYCILPFLREVGVGLSQEVTTGMCLRGPQIGWVFSCFFGGGGGCIER